MNVKFADLVDETVSPESYARFDRPDAELRLTLQPEFVRDFYRDGLCVLPGLATGDMIDPYVALWKRLSLPLTGFGVGHPYTKNPEIRDLCCDRRITDKLAALFDGDEVGLHLNLTGWLSTERSWHQDAYLSPIQIGSHYVATWIALDDISPDSGPFEYAVGSHRSPFMTSEKIFDIIGGHHRNNPDWPWISQDMVSGACEDDIREKGYDVRKFIPKRGDVLFWHSRLLHRGTVPNTPGTVRKALISHYSVVNVRSKIDMPNYERHKDQGIYFKF